MSRRVEKEAWSETLATRMKALDTNAVEVAVLKGGRFRMTSVRELDGQDLGSALAEVPLAVVKFVRMDVPPELKGLCPSGSLTHDSPAAHTTAHAERTNRCSAHSMGCKFSVRGNSVGRHEQVCPLLLAKLLLDKGSKIESFDAFFAAVVKLRGADTIGASANFITRINRQYGSYDEMLARARKPSMRALDVIRGVLDADDKDGSIAEGMLNVARAELMERLEKAKSTKAKERIRELIDDVELYFKGDEP